MKLRAERRRGQRGEKAAQLLEPEPTQDNHPFVVERDLKPGDWGLFLSLLNHYRERENWVEFAKIALDIALLCPDRISELGLDEATWNKLKANLEKRRAGRGPDDPKLFVKLAMSMKLLFPEKVNELRLDEASWEKVKAGTNRERAPEISDWYMPMVLGALVLYPGKMSELGLQNPDLLDEARQYYRKKSQNLTSKEFAEFKLVFPSLFEEFGGIHPDYWPTKLNWFEAAPRRTGFSLILLDQASGMKLLADNARLMPDGFITYEAVKRLPGRARMPERRMV